MYTNLNIYVNFGVCKGESVHRKWTNGMREYHSREGISHSRIRAISGLRLLFRGGVRMNLVQKGGNYVQGFCVRAYYESFGRF
jgi:hypothetical protein